MIRVAQEGYDGNYEECGPVIFVDGVLHQAIRPINSGMLLWVPVRHYVGPVQYVDKRGRYTPAAPEAGKTEGRS